MTGWKRARDRRAHTSKHTSAGLSNYATVAISAHPCLLDNLIHLSFFFPFCQSPGCGTFHGAPAGQGSSPGGGTRGLIPVWNQALLERLPKAEDIRGSK